MTHGLCPQCKVTPVIRTKRFGTFPRCVACLDLNKRGRYDRRNDKRKEGYSTHHNTEGIRYASSASLVEVVCFFCGSAFQRSSRLIGRAVCSGCRVKKDEKRREKNVERGKKLYWADPQGAREKRLIRTLRKMGIGQEWYDARRGRCGICGTTEPGGKGYWHLDHDHGCCPYGVRAGCAKCVRGILCHFCNLGLGLFKDDPTRLRAAAAWVERPRETAA
jgi:hypothetical protein